MNANIIFVFIIGLMIYVAAEVGGFIPNSPLCNELDHRSGGYMMNCR
jgi:hypothetical protein